MLFYLLTYLFEIKGKGKRKCVKFPCRPNRNNNNFNIIIKMIQCELEYNNISKTNFNLIF